LSEKLSEWVKVGYNTCYDCLEGRLFLYSKPPIKKHLEDIAGFFGGDVAEHTFHQKPSEITARNIVRVLEGYIDSVFCVNPEITGRECHRAPKCATGLLWKKVGEKIAQVLDSTTLEDLVKMDKELKNG